MVWDVVPLADDSGTVAALKTEPAPGMNNWNDLKCVKDQNFDLAFIFSGKVWKICLIFFQKKIAWLTTSMRFGEGDGARFGVSV